MQLISLILLLLLSAFFSASETAITTISRIKIKHLLQRKKSGAKSLSYLRENPGRMLTTVLIGNNIVNILASVLAATIIIATFKDLIKNNLAVEVAITTSVMTFLILTFGEIIPKTIAIRNAEKISLTVSPIIVTLEKVFKPIAILVTFISKPFIFILGGNTPTKGPILTEDEIKLILSVGEKEGVIEEDEQAMISSIFEFGDTTVHEVMTPKPDVQSVNKNNNLEEIIKIIVEKGHSRFPVCDGNLDNIIGVVYAKDLLKVFGAKESFNIEKYLRPALFIPEGKMIDDLLKEMQAARTHIAIVVDEYGSTAGVVSLEDILEEIVGEIHDEFERGVIKYEKVDANTVIVDGRMNISDLNEYFETFLPEQEYDTIAGYVFGRLGKLPAVGDVVHYAELKICVEKVQKRRITKLKITKQSKSDEIASVGG